LAGIRITYFAPRPSNASLGSPIPKIQIGEENE
jgi:hypothetical protein